MTLKLSNEDISGVYFKYNPTLRGFVDCLLWATTDDDGIPLDANYTRADIAPETLRRIGGLVATFLGQANAAFPSGTPTHDAGHALGGEQGGRDLFLTAARHGSGFDDGEWGDDGETLKAIVRAVADEGAASPLEGVYVGDDGLVYVLGWER